MHIEIPTFESVRALVVGDVMLDRYWYGSTSRISPEAPVPVVHIQDLVERPGGAGNVALNLRALGCAVTLMGLVGEDDSASSLRKLLRETTVDCDFTVIADFATVTKLRVIGHNQQLIRLDFEKKNYQQPNGNLLINFNKQLSAADIVVLSDYAKGALKHIQPFIAKALAAGLPVLIDPKSTDFSLYQGATLVKPNLKEFEAVVGPCATETELVTKGQKLLQTHNIHALLITRGEQGMTLLQAHREPLHLPTRAREVYDVTGAGDTVIATLAAAIAAGQSLENAAMYANTAAGIVVQKLGAATVSVPELRRALQRHYDSEVGILTEEELLIAIADARAHDETIVMTNGCFDILHAGHIAYLEEAKSLGKRLIVAVNDDASVKRLKGEGRPINNLHDRMAVLAALRAVDWVVPFSEATPERLIKLIKPDVLVKGGDYKVSDIAGSDFVLANGGKVELLKYIVGCSTSAIIERAKKNTEKN